MVYDNINSLFSQRVADTLTKMAHSIEKSSVELYNKRQDNLMNEILGRSAEHTAAPGFSAN